MKDLKNFILKYFFTRFILLTTLIMGVSLIGIVYSHAQNTEKNAAVSIQLSQSEKAWLDVHPTVTIAGPRNFPPFRYYEKGKLKGICADYTTRIAAQSGFKLQTRAGLPWPQVLKSVRQGNIDLVTCIAKTAERETYLDFSMPYLTFPLVIVSNENAPFIGGIEDLYGKTLAVQPKSLILEWLRRDGIDFSPIYVQSTLQGLKQVAYSGTDATIENLATATYLIHKNELSNLKIAAPTHYDDYQLYMAVPKGNKELLGIVNKTLATLSPQKNSNIRSQWLTLKYDYNISPQQVFRYALLALLFSLGVIFIILFRNHRLAKETRERISTEKALRKSEEKLRNILENSYSMYYAHTPEHELTYVSLRCRQILQCEPEEAMKQWTEFITDNPINLKGFECTQKAIETGQRQPPYELELKGKKGRMVIVEVREAPIVENSRTVGVVGSLTDITEHKKAEEYRQALQHQLIQAGKMEFIGTLAGGVAHDFNNILGIILGNAELALLDTPEENPARTSINEIQTACIRAKEVVMQLLSFSRQTKQKKQPIDLDKLVADTVKLLRASLPSSIEIEYQNDQPTQSINANSTQIQQLIINLCNNSAQAMEPKGKGGTLTLSLKIIDTHNLQMPELKKLNAEQAVRLTIKDTGTGIDPAIQDRVFDPYFTTKEVGKGSGMGLAIVHGIVHNHDGVVTFKSEQGRGTVFTVLLPASLMPVKEEVPNTAPVPEGTKNILLVDDEKGLTDMLAIILKRLGYTIKACQDPEKALAEFRASPFSFDLIITDITMPHINGVEFCAAIKKIRRDIPVIVCTGHSSQSNSGVFENADISAVIMKPVTTMEIAKTIRQVVKKS